MADLSLSPPVGASEAASSDHTLPLEVLLVFAALTAAVVAQGGFYRSGQRLIGIVLFLAAAVAWRARRLSFPLATRPPLVLAAALAVWAVVSAALAGNSRDAGGTVALVVGLTVVAGIVGSCTAGERATVVVAALGLGVVIASVGWVGVAWRVRPWALEDQGLWRAAGTITYANAAAGVLAPLALVAVARLVASPSAVAAAGACVLLSGLGATLSRGGLLAFGVGLGILAALLGARALTRAMLAPVLGASAALAALLPAVPANSSPRPLLALAGLAGGAVLAAAASGVSSRHVVAAAAVAGIATALALGWSGGVGDVANARVTVSSPDRRGETTAALRLAAAHPVAGVGPDHRQFAWTDADGTPRVARFAHNEYLQVLAELGAVGLGLLLGLLAAVGRWAWSGRAAAPSPAIWAGVMAGLAALGVHAALDFGWHVPAVPLTGALLVGIVTPKREKEQP